MIELFSGIGAQIQGTNNTNLFDCTVVNTSDIDKEAMVSYAAIHCGLTKETINTYGKYPSREEMAQYLTDRNIGFDFKKMQSCDWFKIAKKKTNDINKYYLACVLSNNMGDISRIEKLPYADFWTYSFPCQDISVAGKQAGIVKGETRSGLLYEVERLLDKANSNETLPKYLLLENVKNLVGKKHIDNFNVWLKKLNDLGYNTYWYIANGKTCGIPQNRERCFALSIRKDIDTKKFEFAKPFDNGLRMRDLLENDVDERYYLKTVKDFFIKHSIECEKEGNGFRFKPHNPTKAETAFAVTTRAGGRMDDNYISETDIGDTPYFEFTDNNLRQIGYINNYDGDANRVYADNMSRTLKSEAGGGGAKTGWYQMNDIKIRKLTEKECWRLMGFPDDCIDKAIAIDMSSTALYKQAGNSIITNCISLIMEHLYKAQYDENYICTDENFTQPQVD